MSPTLYIVRGLNQDGEWKVYVLATSPGDAVDKATAKKSWSISSPLFVEMPIDFIPLDPTPPNPHSERVE